MGLVYEAAIPAYRTHEQCFKPHQMTRVREYAKSPRSPTVLTKPRHKHPVR